MLFCGTAFSVLQLISGLTMNYQNNDWQQLLTKETIEANGKKLPYRMMKPETVENGKKYPLVIFLHGAGERGTDNQVQLVHGVKEFAKASSRKDFPCYLIAPQCPTGKKWVEVDWSAKTHKTPGEPSESMSLLIQLLDKLQKSEAIDPARIYVTGLSMGGYGTWDLLCRHPEKFAAGVPVCGGGDEAQAKKIANLPIWVFHGAKDTAVIPERSRNMVKALEASGGKPKYTEYPDVAHNSWDKAYSDPEMMKWLFSQKRK